MAPEVWSGRPYNEKCDMWALGCVVYELAAWEPPFKAASLHALSERIKRGARARRGGRRAARDRCAVG